MLRRHQAFVFWGKRTRLQSINFTERKEFIFASFVSAGIWNWAVVTQRCHTNRTSDHADLKPHILVGLISDEGIRVLKFT